MLVDAGLDADGTAILAELSAQHLGPRDVRAVLLTHGHPDHFAAAHRFEAATVVVGADDVAMVRGDRTHYAPFGRIIGAAPSAAAGPADADAVSTAASRSPSTARPSPRSRSRGTRRAASRISPGARCSPAIR